MSLNKLIKYFKSLDFMYILKCIFIDCLKLYIDVKIYKLNVRIRIFLGFVLLVKYFLRDCIGLS